MRDEPAGDSRAQIARSRGRPRPMDMALLAEVSGTRRENSGLRLLAKLIVREIEASDLTGGNEGVSVVAKEA